MNAAVFLDRDNTLIHNDGDLGDPNEIRLIQGAASAVGSLCGLGYKVVVVTNQAGVARGKFTEQDVEAVHQRLREQVKASALAANITHFYYCPYHPEAKVKQYKREHPWRKPNPGMLLQAAKDLDLDLSQCWMIGDQMRDVLAGAAAKVRTILIRSDDNEDLDDGQAGVTKKSKEVRAVIIKPNYVARSVVEAVRIVAQQRKSKGIDLIGIEEPRNQVQTTSVIRSGRHHNRRSNSEVGGASSVPSSPQTHVSQGRDHTAASTSSLASRRVRSAQSRRIPNGKLSESERGQAVSDPQTTEQTTREPQSTRAPHVAKVDPVLSSQSESVADNLLKEDPDKKRSSDSNISVSLTLRQILQELRNQRTASSDFSYLSVVAIVLQLVVLVCLLAALMLGRDEDALFFRWLGSGLLIQLATIAALLIGR